jgi:CubicO group peptidase (beta-lactamase class C family)
MVTEYYSDGHSQLSGARFVQADSQFHMVSVTKSYVGLAVVFAEHECRIHCTDVPVTDYLPNLDHAIMEGTLIRHLLTLSWY